MPKKKTTKAPTSASLLVELLTEELPPMSLQRLAERFRDALAAGLEGAILLPRPYVARPHYFATPRRLAVLIQGVLEKATDVSSDTAGPLVSAGAEAAKGFAKKYGVAVESLKKIPTSDGEKWLASYTSVGAVLDDVLAQKVEEALKVLPVQKLMRWGNSEAQFARPVHGLVMMHGNRIIPGKIWGLESRNYTLGHRFLSSGKIEIPGADQYEAVLEKKGSVIVSLDKRKELIRAELEKKAAGVKIIWDDALLDEVTALVEYPVVYSGSFSPEFLGLPQECLIVSMQQHQRYFPLSEANGKLLPRFLMVSNMRTANPANVIRGNERVLRARLADAKFFYDQDRKMRLEARVPKLGNVVYHNKLGSQLERVERIKSLSKRIVHALGTDTQLVERAAWLSKADLLTDMVGEFPELQGVMGRYYAVHDGESVEVAKAIEQHYRPRFAGDQLPESLISCALALADKLYAIAGMFAAGQPPTGDKDPFALRRQALGVIRILIERKLDIRLQSLVDLAIGELPAHTRTDWLPVLEFLLDRARSYFAGQGFAKQAIEAVIQPFGASSPLYTLSEIVAEASRFIATEEGKILAEANKRITNILKKSGFEVPFGLRPDQLIVKPKLALFKEKAEIEFWDALRKIGGESVELRNQHRFAESLRVLSQLGKPTKSFFDGVLVNAEEPDIRENRITLLQHARAYMNQVAELSLMAQ